MSFDGPDATLTQDQIRKAERKAEGATLRAHWRPITCILGYWWNASKGQHEKCKRPLDHAGDCGP